MNKHLHIPGTVLMLSAFSLAAIRPGHARAGVIDEAMARLTEAIQKAEAQMGGEIRLVTLRRGRSPEASWEERLQKRLTTADGSGFASSEETLITIARFGQLVRDVQEARNNLAYEARNADDPGTANITGHLAVAEFYAALEMAPLPVPQDGYADLTERLPEAEGDVLRLDQEKFCTGFAAAAASLARAAELAAQTQPDQIELLVYARCMLQVDRMRLAALRIWEYHGARDRLPAYCTPHRLHAFLTDFRDRLVRRQQDRLARGRDTYPELVKQLCRKGHELGAATEPLPLINEVDRDLAQNVLRHRTAVEGATIRRSDWDDFGRRAMDFLNQTQTGTLLVPWMEVLSSLL